MNIFKLIPAALAVTAGLLIASGCNSSNSSGAEGSARWMDDGHPRVSFAATADVRPPAIPAAAPRDYGHAMHLSGRRDGEHLGVLTFNMQHKDNPEQMAALARRLRSDLREMPDFILCQEVMFDRSDRKGQENTAEVLADAAGYFVRGTKRSSDREGVAILSRYPFEHYDSRELKSQTSRLLLGFNRVSVMGEFKVPAIGRVRVVNVHFTNWRFEERVRTNQLRETLQWITDREKQVRADLTILGGDFNMLPDGDERVIVTDRRETGNLVFKDFNTDDPTRGPAGYPTTRVDYVFVASAKCDVRFLGEDRLYKSGLRDGDGDKFYLSDHVPVLHEYIVRAGPRGSNTITVQAQPDTPTMLMR